MGKIRLLNFHRRRKQFEKNLSYEYSQDHSYSWTRAHTFRNCPANHPFPFLPSARNRKASIPLSTRNSSKVGRSIEQSQRNLLQKNKNSSSRQNAPIWYPHSRHLCCRHKRLRIHFSVKKPSTRTKHNYGLYRTTKMMMPMLEMGAPQIPHCPVRKDVRQAATTWRLDLSNSDLIVGESNRNNLKNKKKW